MWINQLSKIVLALAIIALLNPIDAQYKRKKKKSDFFGGARDFSVYRNTGIQFEIGPTYTFGGKTINAQSNDSLGRIQKYELNPGGNWGVFANVGMAHILLKGFKYKAKGADGKRTEIKKLLILSYLDWGVGVKMLRGNEQSTYSSYFANGTGPIGSPVEGKRSFMNNYAFGRITAHRLFDLTKKWSIDFGLGANFDYRFAQNFKESGAFSSAASTSSKPMMVALHTELGFTYTVKRGTFINIGASTPLVGIQSARFPEFQSKYWPVLFKFKVIKLLKVKNKKGCPPVQKAPGDTKTD